MKFKILFFVTLIIAFLQCSKNSTEISYTDKLTLTKISITGRDVYYGQFTASGDRVIYPIWDNEVSEIHSVNVDGENDKILLKNLGDGIVDGPIISPNDNKLAFVVQYNSPSHKEQIHICNIDGTNLTTLVESRGSLFVTSFSYDGSWILYDYYHQMGNIAANSIWLANTVGSENRELTYGNNSIPISFFPNEYNILYASDPDGYHFGAFAMDSSGNNITRITPDSLFLFPRALSPSGDKILCIARIINPKNRKLNREIYIVNRDGSELKRLTNSVTQDYPVCFSPDGSTILYYSVLDTIAESERSWEIFIMRIDGNHKKRLTTNDYRDYPIAFNPAGTKILFQAKKNEDYGLYIMNL